ncbi:MAG: hypothetical protein ACREJ3_04180 [Polyangiaceae bacterium]
MPAVLPPDAQVEIAPMPPTGEEVVAPPSPEALAEVPPPRPRRRGLVLESTLGVLGFGGEFGHVSPPAYWLHAQLGYEVLDPLMVFVEGELAFADTSEAADPSSSRAFPIWGFGAGARGTLHATPRVALFVQGEIGALAADVPHDALALYGFRNAESLIYSFGARWGVEWYGLDRHVALTMQLGGRDATGFAKVATAGTALMWDAGAGIRYTF